MSIFCKIMLNRLTDHVGFFSKVSFSYCSRVILFMHTEMDDARVFYAGTLDPAYPALLKAARQSTTVVMATPPHEQHSATLLYLLTMLTQKGAPESREDSWKQRFRSLQTTVPAVRNVRSGRQHGTVRANHDVQVRFQD